MRTSIIVAVIAALAAPNAAIAKPAKHRKHVAERHVVHRPPQQIACTVIGCVPVPPGCGQTPGRTWSGMPTGGDVIVCPPGVAPFR
jgi:hypothetical protein